VFFHGAPDVDEVVGDDAEADPAVHSDIALVAAAAQAMSPFGDADASLTAGTSASTSSACVIQSSRRSLTSSAISPSPKPSCARRISIMLLAPPL
jgi:hypothetical protein